MQPIQPIRGRRSVSAVGPIAAAGLALAHAVGVSAPAAVAQNQSGAIRGGALRVFLDCNTFQCDSDHFRTEIDFVNWVRDRTLADVHLIVTSNQTGGGGNVFTLDFIGQGDLQGDDDELALTVIATDTEDEVLTALTGVMAAGLARYSAAIGQAASVAISAIDPGGVSTDELVGAEQVDDPWNFWVFEIGADIELEGEDFENQRQYEGRFDASRTTETWKFELDAFGSWTREEIQLDSGEVAIDERNNWNVDFLLARAIGAQWSLGLVAGAGASSRLNQEFGADASVALEYSFLPYVEAPRRSLTARYDLRVQYYDWEEETIYFQTEELRPQHQLRLQLFQRQPWGESRISVDGSQFLHDGTKWNVSLQGDLEFRIVRGLNLDLRAELNLIEDQLFISSEGLTLEEILLGRFERPTDSSYEFSAGLSFEFGSIFNNVVNNRFDSRGFGGGGDFN
jgi:hypothetical protein